MLALLVYTLNAKSERNHAKIRLPMQAPQSLISSSQFCCQATVVWRLVGRCPCCNEWEEADSGMVKPSPLLPCGKVSHGLVMGD